MNHLNKFEKYHETTVSILNIFKENMIQFLTFDILNIKKSSENLMHQTTEIEKLT